MINITEREFKDMSNYIRSNYGINLKPEKKALVIGRLSKIMQERELTTFSEYFSFLKCDATPCDIINFIDRITTNHTYFMREPKHFEYFANIVLPSLKSKIKNRDLRVWCAASSTGEEPYTIAMIIDEFLGDEKKLWDSKVLATDISTKALEIAQNGEYDLERVNPLPKIWILNYFDRINADTFRVKNKLRNEVVFRRFNLMEKNYRFKKELHVVFCRNVMIYFDKDAKQEVLNKIYESMMPGGFLFLGHSESIGSVHSGFKLIKPSMYQKI